VLSNAAQDTDHWLDFVAFVGEFVGTTMFLFFAFAGTQVANIGSSQNDANTTTGADTGFSPAVLQVSTAHRTMAAPIS
jgi:hypothetical protein